MVSQTTEAEREGAMTPEDDEPAPSAIRVRATLPVQVPTTSEVVR